MHKLAFIGAGRMATAMVSGLLESESYKSAEIACASAPDGTAELLASETGIAVIQDRVALCREADSIVLAVKPQQLSHLGRETARDSTGKLLISILAGTPLRRLRETFPTTRNIVRAMPNTPGQIGAGITCFASLNPLAAPDEKAVLTILGSMGPALPLSEHYLDAVTALSGSGPAYLFEFVAGLRDGGVEAGLAPEIAFKLALETTLGAARLLARSGETPETLRDRVASPGGTTLAGLEVMGRREFRRILAETIRAAKNRSIELSQ